MYKIQQQKINKKVIKDFVSKESVGNTSDISDNIMQDNSARVFSAQYRAAPKWRGGYQRNIVIVRIAHEYLSCSATLCECTPGRSIR